MSVSSTTSTLVSSEITVAVAMIGVTGWGGVFMDWVDGVDGVSKDGVLGLGRDLPFLKQSGPSFSVSLMDSTQDLHTKKMDLVNVGKFLRSSEQQELHIILSHFRQVMESWEYSEGEKCVESPQDPHNSGRRFLSLLKIRCIVPSLV